MGRRAVQSAPTDKRLQVIERLYQHTLDETHGTWRRSSALEYSRPAALTWRRRRSERTYMSTQYVDDSDIHACSHVRETQSDSRSVQVPKPPELTFMRSRYNGQPIARNRTIRYTAHLTQVTYKGSRKWTVMRCRQNGRQASLLDLRALSTFAVPVAACVLNPLGHYILGRVHHIVPVSRDQRTRSR